MQVQVSEDSPRARLPGNQRASVERAASDEPQYLSHQQIVVVLFGLMAGVMLAALDQSIVGTALPRIVSELGRSHKLAWVVTAYLLTAMARPHRSGARSPISMAAAPSFRPQFSSS